MASLDLKAELQEMEKLLLEIRNGTKDLIKDVKERPKLTEEQKRDRSKSSWARSKTPRGKVTSQSRTESKDLLINPEKAERHTKTRAPAYSLGVKLGSPESEIPSATQGPPPTAYEVKVELSSKYKRPFTTTFGSEPRSRPECQDPVPPVSMEVPSSLRPPETRGYSFGKADRIKNQVDIDDDIIEKPLDVDKADKWLYYRPPAPIIRPPTNLGPGKQTIEVDEVRHDNEGNYDDINIDKLSHRFSSPVVRIHPEGDSRPSTARSLAPGYYDVKDDFVSNILKSNTGKIYQEPKRQRSISRDRSTPGPGYYNVEAAEEKLRTKTSIVQLKARDNTLNESVHLQRKHYLEEKCRDAREFHDNQRDASDIFIRQRAPVTVIATPSRIIDSDPKLSNIHSKLQAERLMEAPRSYDVNFEVVERKAPVMVSMARELKARENTSTMLHKKPAVMRALAEQIEAERGPDLFYGPNLPVEWVPDRPGMLEVRDPASPTKDILQFLCDLNQNHRLESSTAHEYLRSSLAGSLARKPTAIMRSDRTTFSKIIPQDDNNHEVLGPIDWLEEMAKRESQHKFHAVRMDISTGRDKIEIRSKGLVSLQAFNSTERAKTDSLGPGAYDHQFDAFGENVKGVVAFDKVPSRHEVIGPHGEKPEASRGIAEGDLEDINAEKLLDIDRGDALDALKKNPRGFTLYTKDRFEPISIDESKHLGGSWFKGMAEQVTNTKAVVNYSKMNGRYDDEADLKYLGEEFEDHVNDERRLELEVKDWNPSSKREVTVKFQDETKYPRFPDKGEDILGEEGRILDLSPHHDIVRKNDNPLLVRMDKMTGRNDDDGALLEDMDGKIAVDLAKQLASDNQRHIQFGKDLTSKMKKTPMLVRMNKQIGRHDDDINIEDIYPDAMIDERSHVVHKSDIAVAKVRGGADDWSKNIGRDQVDDEKLLRDQRLVDPSEAIDLSANHETLSGFQRPVTGPAWKNLADEGRFPPAKEPAANDAIYDNIDPGKFKKGLHAIGEGGVGPGAMVKQRGREVDRAEQKLEELIVEPKDDGLKRRVKGVSSMKSLARWPGQESVVDNDKQTLDINPVVQTKKMPQVSMAKQKGRVITSSTQEVELIVEPNEIRTSRNKSVSSTTFGAMKPTNQRIKAETAKNRREVSVSKLTDRVQSLNLAELR